MFNIRKFLSIIFINVMVSDKNCVIKSYSIKNEKLIKTTEQTFEIEQKKGIKNHLEKLIDNHYFSYVSLFFTSIGQGILPSTNKMDLNKFGIDDSAITLKQFDKSFLYAAITELKDADVVLDDLHVDLVYSPFAILYKIIKDRKKDGFIFDGMNLFVLRYGEFICIMIYKNDMPKFGSFFELKTKDANIVGEKTLDIEEDVTDLKDDELDELNFDELEDIKIDENFNLDENLEREEEADNIETLGLDMMVFDYINNAIAEFYSNNAYDSDFINNIVIFEHDKSSKAMHAYIENELMIKPMVYKVDIFDKMLRMSVEDLGVKVDL